MTKEGNQKKKETDSNPVQEALAVYIQKIARAYGLPEDYVANKFNLKKFNEYQQKYHLEAVKKFGEGYKVETDPNYLHEMIKYVTSDDAFSDELKKAGDLEEALTKRYYGERTFKQKLRDFLLGKDKNEPKYKQFSDTPLYNVAQVFASDPNYKNILPKGVIEAVEVGVKADYQGKAVIMGYTEGMLSKDQAIAGKNASLRIVDNANKKLKTGLESVVKDLYKTASSMAAGIFGVLGIVVLMMQMQFTGAIVGTDLSTHWGYYYGLGLILISLVMFTLLRKNLINEPKHEIKRIKHKPAKIKKSKIKKVKPKVMHKTKQHKAKKTSLRKIKKVRRK